MLSAKCALLKSFARDTDCVKEKKRNRDEKSEHDAIIVFAAATAAAALFH